MVKSLNGGGAAHTVLTELDDQKLFRRGMASIKSTSSYISRVLSRIFCLGGRSILKNFWSHAVTRKKFFRSSIVRTLKEEQPLRLLLNLLFYHFNRSESTYYSQRIKLLDVIAACNQLNVNALN